MREVEIMPVESFKVDRYYLGYPETHHFDILVDGRRQATMSVSITADDHEITGKPIVTVTSACVSSMPNTVPVRSVSGRLLPPLDAVS